VGAGTLWMLLPSPGVPWTLLMAFGALQMLLVGSGALRMLPDHQPGMQTAEAVCITAAYCRAGVLSVGLLVTAGSAAVLLCCRWTAATLQGSNQHVAQAVTNAVCSAAAVHCGRCVCLYHHWRMPCAQCVAYTLW
jgi:hypothetical protein